MHDATVGSLQSLPFFKYRIDFRLAHALVLDPARRAVLWRGALGAVFRSLVCHDVQLACDTCPLESSCPYPRVFAPRLADPAIARLRDPPRPFILRDPQPESASLPSGELLSLGLTLVGNAVLQLPYFITALRLLGEEGVGRTQARFRVDAVHSLDAVGVPAGRVFERGSDLVRPVRAPINVAQLMRPGDPSASKLRVRFVTPTDLRGGDNAAEVPPFGRLVRRARDRISALATFFAAPLTGLDLRAVGESADSVTVAASELGVKSVARTSARTGQRHDVGGTTGFVIYEGAAIGAAMPWLRLAESLGVGKHATFGSGCISTEVLA
jgi:hypothetical protein